MNHWIAKLPAPKAIGKQIDQLPPLTASLLGVLLGGGGVFLLAQIPFWWAVSGVVMISGLAYWLAAQGGVVIDAPPQPVATAEQPVKEKAAVFKVIDDLWVEVAAGSFLMGSPETERDWRPAEGPLHRVHISTLRCMRVSVTKKLYHDVLDRDKSISSGEGSKPMVNVSWFDAVQFCNQWSVQENLIPCYKIQGTRVNWLADCDGYRLPTEAEWEYLARAGSTGSWSCGEDEAALEKYAWYNKNSQYALQPVATRQANSWQLYDFHGNVWEWCWDWYGPYSASLEQDPRGSSHSGTIDKVLASR